MSGPSSDGRHSLSSELSATSSHTLNSRYSGAYRDNGEGSSLQRSSLVGSQHHSASGPNAMEAGSRDYESPYRDESVEERDFAHRRQHNRRSGGFLLDSALPTGPRPRPQSSTITNREDVTGKRTSRNNGDYDGSRHRDRTRAPNIARSPLSRQVELTDNNHGGTQSKAHQIRVPDTKDGEIHIVKQRRSFHPAYASAPFSGDGQDLANEPARPTIDPDQIVHMALNLSESRRRNMSAGQLLVAQSGGSRRVASAALANDGSFRNSGVGGSLRQYLNEQRRASRNVSPGTAGRDSQSGLRQMSIAIPRNGTTSMQGQRFDPSEATLARRDRARAYMELRMEYLRLLDLLPPLKPDATAPGNFIVTAANVPGSPHVQLTRVQSHAGKKHELGRAYNPLQYLRNRRSRARERRALSHVPEEFADIEEVRDWVDKVEKASQDARYRGHDRVALPDFHDGHEKQVAPTKPARPRMGWIFTPQELLADAHWLEQGDNKTLIEDRHGRKIFPPSEPPKQNLLQARGSAEYTEKRRRSWVEGLPGLSGDNLTADESETGSDRGRKRRLLPAFRAESPRNKKYGWRDTKGRSASHSEGSESESDARKRRPGKRRGEIDAHDNTGPLALRMKELLQAEARNTEPISPSILTPDTPDKWGMRQKGVPKEAALRKSQESARLPNGSALAGTHIDLKAPPKNRRTNRMLSEESTDEPRSSFEGQDSTAPGTPIHPYIFPHIGADLSPPRSRGASLSRKAKKHRLDIFRSDENGRAHKLEPDSAESDKKRNSKHLGDEAADGAALSTALLAAPNTVKSLLTHRKNDSVSSLTSPETGYRRETKDPSSAMTRFFKGVKNEGSKVGEFIFRKDRPAEDTDEETLSDVLSVASETDEGPSKPSRNTRPGLLRSATGTTVGSVTSKKGSRYHLELPSFRSSNQNDDETANATDAHFSDDHITRQALARARSRSARFDELAPPPMDLRSISATSSPAPSRTRSPGSGGDRLTKVLARPGGVGAGGFPVTGLAQATYSDPPRNRSTSRPTLDGKRHWSITDEDGTSLHRKISPNIITQSDIARIQALFLCSGVKAREIDRRGHTMRPEAPMFLVRAAKTANAQLIPVPRKEEHVLAARILVRTLENATQSLHTSAQEFRESTVKDLTSAISSLKSRVESDLFPRVRKSGDEAIRVTQEVSTAAPLTVKQVNDEIDRMIRARRRRMRWARRVGWMLVEWALLGLMWWLWFIVVVFSTVKRIFGFGFRTVRWLLWL